MAPSVVTPEHPKSVSQDLIDWMRSIFGAAFSVSRGYSAAHDGIDLPANIGTPIRAIAAGKVSYAKDARLQVDKGSQGWAIGGGNVVNVDIGNNLTTQYAHLSGFIVREGQYVAKGQVIGYVGNTGGTNNGVPGGPGSTFSGPHLHFGLWDKSGSGFGKMINPQTFFENNTSKDEIVGMFYQNGKPLIEYQRGRVLTEQDVDNIMSVLTSHHYFDGIDPTGNAPAVTRGILMQAVQDRTPWGDDLAVILQKKLMLGAEISGNIGDDIAKALDIPAAIKQLGETFIFIAVIVVGIAFVLLAGLITRSKSEASNA